MTPTQREGCRGRGDPTPYPHRRRTSRRRPERGEGRRKTRGRREGWNGEVWIVRDQGVPPVLDARRCKEQVQVTLISRETFIRRVIGWGVTGVEKGFLGPRLRYPIKISRRQSFDGTWRTISKGLCVDTGKRMNRCRRKHEVVFPTRSLTTKRQGD